MRALTIATIHDQESKHGGPVKTRTASQVLRNPKIEVVDDLALPEVGPTDILIRVRTCGMCGSDVAMASEDEKGFVRYPFMMSSLIVPGHEFAGEVAEMGSIVHEYWPALEIGDPVTAQCVLNCGFCPPCKIGKFDLCENGDELGFTRNGAMAEYCVVDMRHVWSLKPLQDTFHGEDLFVAGSLIEPHAGVYKAITEKGVQPGKDVFIIGAGPIGLAALSVYRALGAGNIFVAELSENRRGLAQKLGAHVFDPTIVSIEETILNHEGSVGVSAIFEAAGVAERNWPAIISLVEQSPPGVHIIFFGQSKQPVEINPQLFIQRYTEISGSHGHTKVWPTVIELFAAGRINPLAMTTRHISLDEAPHWIEELATNKEEAKVTITRF